MRQEPSSPSDRGVLSTRQGQFQAPHVSGMKRPLLRWKRVLLAEPQQTPKPLARRTRRSLQRGWRQTFTGLALLLALGQPPVLAGTINVNAKCTLAEAVNSANRDLPLGGCAIGIRADRIVLPANSVQTIQTTNPNGLIINTAIMIVGNGSTIRRIGGDSDSRVFTVTASALRLQSVAVSRSDDDDLDGDDDRGRGRGRGGDDDAGFDDNPSGDDDRGPDDS